MDKKITVYVRNKDITPSSYYRIVQYLKHLEGDITLREIAPKNLYKNYLNLSKKNKFKKNLISVIYYIVMLCRVTYYLMIDYINKPKYIVVSKTFCPRYTPIFLRKLIKNTTRKSTLYWDFDDHIFESGEISRAQAKIIEEESKSIIVTNEFLKSKIDMKFQDKVILLPTTDGDMQGFDCEKLKKMRKTTFEKEIRLVWVATAGNLPDLKKIIRVLDDTATKLKDDYGKVLLLTVVCNKPIEVNVINLKINNVVWTRKRAIEEIYNSHIGIMPLIPRQFALGKGGFKLVQYISTGLPVIASNIGFNKEIVDIHSGILVNDLEDNEEWKDAITQLSLSWDIWENYSDNSFKRWKESFSYKDNLRVWKSLLN